MIIVFIEERQGKIKKSSLEAMSVGKSLADRMNSEVQAFFIGHDLEGLGAEVFKYGAVKVHLLDNPLLSSYSASGFAQAAAALIAELKPELILLSATSMGKDLAPRLAAKLGVSCATDCTKVDVIDGAVEVLRPVFAGKALASFRFRSKPMLATLRPNVFSLSESGSGQGEVMKKDIILAENQVKTKVVDLLKEEGEELDVTEADIIVTGGRGMKGPENFDLLRDLTKILPHAALGASRSAVDSGWIDHQHQVGQTGKTVSPNLYLAIGVSGAIQHLAGMSSSKVIVAVNKDPDAPIFKVADFGVVGDLFEVIPHLKEELKKILAE